MSVPKEYGGIVVGKHGKNLQRIGDSAEVEISSGYDHPLNPGLLAFTISGTPTAIENAKLQIFYAVSGGFTRDKCEENFLILNTGIGPQELVQFVPASARQVYGPADTYSLRRITAAAAAAATTTGEDVDDVAKRMASLNLGLLKVEREGRGATDSRTAVERVARLLRETRGFPGNVRLVARLGQITFRAMGQMVVPANKPHPYATMEPILRDRCTPRFVTITDETETKLAHEALTQLLAESYTPEVKVLYEFKVWDEASHIPLSVTLSKNADGSFALKEAFMVSSKKLICDYLFPTDEPDVRICLDTLRAVEATAPLLDFIHQIRCSTEAAKSESESEDEVLTFPAPATAPDAETVNAAGEEAATTKQRFHAFFLRKKEDVIYRLSEDCFVRTTRVSETGFGNGERNRKWETEIEFITATATAERDQALEARLEAFFDAVLQVRRKLHRS